ncbi:MAG TPA: NrfD/PsrC family molybdoenzyme membrane anchor subunit [Terriglobales bacterium]|nr:NrfD/PsrC family molybdoenzyme membrane anchor subunit [Terriglobales bacterium]
MAQNRSLVPEPSDFDREQRLIEIRRQAERSGEIKAPGVRPSGAPFPVASPETGYYKIPLLKEPPWKPEIPLYFFVGGAAGAAAVVGAIARYTGADRELVRHARWIAAAGSVIAPPLLIADLGRPARFLNMLRVFKPQSPMSVGVWTLLGFSAGAAASTFADLVSERFGPSLPLSILENAGDAASLAFGLPFSNYTGVLIGATAIPVWNRNVGDLPIHFAASGLSAAVGMLELMGHEKSRALGALGLGAALFETWEGVRIETRSHSHLDPLKHGRSGWLTRAGGVLSGPIPLALRLLSAFGGNGRALRRWAGMSAIAGSLITRVAWMQAGQASARNWRLPLEIEENAEGAGAKSEPIGADTGESAIA